MSNTVATATWNPRYISAARAGFRLSPVQGVLNAWRRRGGERASRKKLDDHLLRDVGLTRADVARESCVSFWRE